MPPRRLVWNEKAISDVQELLERRTNKAAVFSCIESNLLTVGNDPNITRQVPGPLRERIFRFQCADGDVQLYLLAVFVYTPSEEIALVRLTTQPL